MAWDAIFGAANMLAMIMWTGLILLLRWLWWRINAWSEIAVMTASLLFANIVDTQEQAELINTQERAIEKKKLLRAELNTVLPLFSCDPFLWGALGGCV